MINNIFEQNLNLTKSSYSLELTSKKIRNKIWLLDNSTLVNKNTFKKRFYSKLILLREKKNEIEKERKKSILLQNQYINEKIKKNNKEITINDEMLNYYKVLYIKYLEFLEQNNKEIINQKEKKHLNTMQNISKKSTDSEEYYIECFELKESYEILISSLEELKNEKYSYNKDLQYYNEQIIYYEFLLEKYLTLKQIPSNNHSIKILKEIIKPYLEQKIGFVEVISHNEKIISNSEKIVSNNKKIIANQEKIISIISNNQIY